MRKQFGSIFLILCLPLLFGCGVAFTDEGPPKIAYGVDICDECSMIISDERFAAAYVTVAGVERRFDDVGGMLTYRQKHVEAVDTYWVHDISSAEWLRASEAYFVLDSDVLTPMGHGIVACAHEEEAHALAYGHDAAQVVDFATLLSLWAIAAEDHEHETH